MATDGESKIWVIITAGTVTMSIASLALACRIYTRCVLVCNFGTDDWAAVVSGILFLTTGLVVTTNVTHGLGRHIWTLDDTQKTVYYKSFYVTLIFYNATLLAVKTAFLLEYYRIFALPHIRRVIVICMAIIGAWSTSQVFVAVFTCTPIDSFWKDLPTHSSCIPSIPLWYINAAGNIATDIAIVLLPMPVLRRMNLKRPQRLFVMGIFSIGLFTVAVSAIRSKYLQNFDDHSWDNVEPACWSMAELASAVTCLCLPTLKPLLVRLRPRTFDGGGAQVCTPSMATFPKRHWYGGISQHFSQDTTVAGCVSHSDNALDLEAARRRSYLLPLPDWIHDGLAMPAHARFRDAGGLQGSVTTTIGSVREEPASEAPQLHMGQIAVRRDVQYDSS